MTAVEKSYGQYKEKTIESSKPEDLTLMLYNGLIKFIVSAQEEISEKNLEAAHNTLMKCQDIVFEFQYCLNMDYEVSDGLMKLYDYMYNKLIEANAKKDADILDEVLEFATELRDTWAEAIKLMREQKTDEDENDEKHEHIVKIEADGASAQIGTDTPKVPSTKALYSKSLRPVGAVASSAPVGAAAGAAPVGAAPAVATPAGAVDARVTGVAPTGALSSAAPVGSVSSAVPARADAMQTGAADAKTAGAAPVRADAMQAGAVSGAAPIGAAAWQTGAADARTAGAVSSAAPTGANIDMTKAPIIPNVDITPVATTLTNSIQGAKNVLNNPFNKMNPGVAAQYSKMAKQKETNNNGSISIASK